MIILGGNFFFIFCYSNTSKECHTIAIKTGKNIQNDIFKQLIKVPV